MPLHPNTRNNNCVDFKSSAVSSFRSGMELCLRRAVELGLGISLVPHLDDGGRWVMRGRLSSRTAGFCAVRQG